LSWLRKTVKAFSFDSRSVIQAHGEFELVAYLSQQISPAVNSPLGDLARCRCVNSQTYRRNSMKATSMYSKLAKTIALATLAASALAVSTVSQARPHYIQDVQYVQGGAQLVITPPQLVIQAPLPPVYVAPPVVYPRQAVVAPVNAPVYGPRYVRDRIYYINGRAYMNGHRYYVRGHAYGHYKPKHLNRHHGRDDRFDRHDGRHDQGRHGGKNR
jgi:hypothetical protein